MSSRTQILERIRSGLRTKAPVPPKPKDGRVFSPLSPTDLVSRFEKELLMLKGEFHQATSETDAQNWIRDIITKNNFQRVTAAPDAHVRQVIASLKVNITQTQDQYGSALKNCDLSITPCSYLIARTGSVVITTDTGYGRAFSVLPHAHLVVARKQQLLPDLADAYHQLRQEHHNQWPSLISIITGPSRTADIEKILVLGAHGPKKLFVLLLEY